MVRGERNTHLRKSAPKAGRLQDRHGLSPGYEMPTHFFNATGPEPHSQGTVAVFRGTLARMEFKPLGVRRCTGVEAEHDFDGPFLERTE